MTNVIAHLKGGPNDDTHRDGMQKAGEEINEWMKITSNDPKKFFDNLFDNLTPSHEFLIEDGAHERKVEKKGNHYKFDDGAQEHFLFVKSELDKVKVDNNGKKTVHMTIPIPQTRGDQSNYTEILIDHLKYFLCGNDPDGEEKAKQYLLAVIFLNRCQ